MAEYAITQQLPVPPEYQNAVTRFLQAQLGASKEDIDYFVAKYAGEYKVIAHLKTKFGGSEHLFHLGNLNVPGERPA